MPWDWFSNCEVAPPQNWPAIGEFRKSMKVHMWGGHRWLRQKNLKICQDSQRFLSRSGYKTMDPGNPFPQSKTSPEKKNLVDVGDETTSNWDHAPEKFPRRTALGIERPAKTSMPSAIRTTIQPLLFQNHLRWGPLVWTTWNNHFRSCCFLLGISRFGDFLQYVHMTKNMSAIFRFHSLQLISPAGMGTHS